MDAGTIMVMCCNSIAASRSFGSRIAHDRPFRDPDAESALSGGISGIATCHGQLNAGKAVYEVSGGIYGQGMTGNTTVEC